MLQVEEQDKIGLSNEDPLRNAVLDGLTRIEVQVCAVGPRESTRRHESLNISISHFEITIYVRPFAFERLYINLISINLDRCLNVWWDKFYERTTV